MGNISNARIGVCSITLDGTDLGHTKGGVEVNYNADYTDIVFDAYGDTPADKVLKGEKFTVKIPLAEITAANISKSIPAGTLTSAGGRNSVKIGRQAGYKLAQNAKLLVLHPVANAAGFKDEDVVIWSAINIGDTKLGYAPDGQMVVELEMMALVNENKTNGNYLATIGDTTL